MNQLVLEFDKLNVEEDDKPVQNTLVQLLGQYGVDLVNIHKDSGRIIAEFESPESTNIAYNALNGIEFMGSHIDVSYRRCSTSDEHLYEKDFADSPDRTHRPQHRRPRAVFNNQQRNFIQPHPPDQYPCRVLLPTNMIKVILGKNGATIQGIQERTRTKVDIHREKGRQTEDTVTTVKGSPQHFSMACREILQVIMEEMQKPEDDETVQPLQLKLLAHDSLCGRVIGKNGSHLNRLKELSGAKIVISNTIFDSFLPYSNEWYPNKERVITLEGSLESICAAEQELTKKLRQWLDNDIRYMSANNFYTVPGSNNLMHMLQGIAPMMARGHPYGMSSDTNGYNPFHQMPMYNYPGLLNAFSSVFSMNQYMPPVNLDTTEHCSIAIPTKAVGPIIGKGGDYINKVKQTSRAQVRVIKGEEGGESRVEIIGSPDAQSKAQAFVFAKIRESLFGQEARLRTEYMVPGECLGRIIGRRGQVVTDIQLKCGTDIEVPKDKQGGPQAPVYITGSLHGTQMTLNRIREIIARSITQDGRKSASGQAGSSHSPPPSPEPSPPAVEDN